MSRKLYVTGGTLEDATVELGGKASVLGMDTSGPSGQTPLRDTIAAFLVEKKALRNVTPGTLAFYPATTKRIDSLAGAVPVGEPRSGRMQQIIDVLSKKVLSCARADRTVLRQ